MCEERVGLCSRHSLFIFPRVTVRLRMLLKNTCAHLSECLLRRLHRHFRIVLRLETTGTVLCFGAKDLDLVPLYPNHESVCTSTFLEKYDKAYGA